MHEGVGISLVVFELYLGRGGHRGVAVAAMCKDKEMVGACGELEGGDSEIGLALLLVDLFEAGAVFSIYAVVNAGAGGGGGGEGCLFYVMNSYGEVRLGRGFGLLSGGKVEFLARNQKKNQEKEGQCFHKV